MCDTVNFYFNIIKIGRASITVDVSVYAQRTVQEGGEEICIIKMAEAVLVYVAIVENRRPRMLLQE
ncbi:hypothetical protein [Nitrosomonas communis]|uniref:hypothetical protein n=1 Tax=Nitrosomonas communis TaxID=44574 RepID=UPI000942E8F7|nr:hypothetical protein [Nitrosomonas communis]